MITAEISEAVYNEIKPRRTGRKLISNTIERESVHVERCELREESEELRNENDGRLPGVKAGFELMSA